MLHIQLIKYVVVGLISNGLLYVIYLFLTNYGLGHKTAMTLLYVVGVLQTFIFNKKWTFSSNGSLPRSFFRYCVSYALGYSVNLLVLYYFVDSLLYPHEVVQGGMILFNAVMLFLLQKFWVFRQETRRINGYIARSINYQKQEGAVAYLSQADLETMGFKKLGCNVQISSKASIYNPELISIGDFSRIDDFCVISGNVEIGRNVHIAVFCNVAGGELGVFLNDFSGLAYSCNVFSQSDDYSGRSLTNPTIPSKYKKEAKKPVIIGKHCIVGTHSVIFPGVVLAEGTSVGAMAMVTKSTEAWSIYSGIPAKKIKTRKMDLLVLEKQFLEECSNLPLN